MYKSLNRKKEKVNQSQILHVHKAGLKDMARAAGAIASLILAVAHCHSWIKCTILIYPINSVTPAPLPFPKKKGFTNMEREE